MIHAADRKGRRRPAAVLGIMLCLAAAAASAAQAQDQPADSYLDPLAFFAPDPAAPALRVLVQDLAGGQSRVFEGKRLLKGSAEVYLPSATVVTVMQASRFWRPDLGCLDLKAAGQDFRVTAGSRLVVTPRGDALLPVPVLAHAGDLWLPVYALSEVFGPQIQERFIWDPEALKLTQGAVEYDIQRLSTEVLGRTTVLHIHCAVPLGYRAASPRPGLIEVKVYGGTIDPRAAAATRARGLLAGVSSRQEDADCLIVLSVDQLVGHFRTYTSEDGTQISVVLEEEQVSALPDPVPRGEVNLNIQAGPVDVTNRISVRTVVIDPGHGGHDMGAVSREGILEKDVNLAVAREMRSYLQRESDLNVVLTRDTDVYLDLTARAEAANSRQGDLFISLHCNSWFNGSAEGLETYFLSPARSDWARSVEAAENQAGAGGGLDVADDVEFIVWELIQNRFISSSSRLAEVIQAEVPAALRIPDRGVRQAGFRVLVGAYMPAVLVEMGFLSNEDEVKRLADRSYQRRLARALGDAVLGFRTEMDALQGGTDGGAGESGDDR